MKQRWRIAAAALFIASGTALACGVCIEDKVAAVYDHGVVQQAAKDGRLVVFCELSGPFEASALAARTKRAAQALPGVDRDSVRTSNDLPAISFVIDPRQQTPNAVVAALRRELAGDSIVPKLIRVMPSAGL